MSAKKFIAAIGLIFLMVLGSACGAKAPAQSVAGQSACPTGAVPYNGGIPEVDKTMKEPGWAVIQFGGVTYSKVDGIWCQPSTTAVQQPAAQSLVAQPTPAQPAAAQPMPTEKKSHFPWAFCFSSVIVLILVAGWAATRFLGIKWGFSHRR
jgi:hypothetical protein